MPANLTPIYRDAEAKFKAAVTREEKIAGLEGMLRVIPKHKGTEHLQADLRSRLSKLRQEPKKKGPSKGLRVQDPQRGRRSGIPGGDSQLREVELGRHPHSCEAGCRRVPHDNPESQPRDDAVRGHRLSVG